MAAADEVTKLAAEPVVQENTETSKCPGNKRSADILEALDRDLNWYAATIVRWEGQKALIHYLGWQSIWNEWFGPEDMLRRTRPLTANPSFGKLSSKQERVRIKRCIRRVEQMWPLQQEAASGDVDSTDLAEHVSDLLTCVQSAVKQHSSSRQVGEPKIPRLSEGSDITQATDGHGNMVGKLHSESDDCSDLEDYNCCDVESEPDEIPEWDTRTKPSHAPGVDAVSTEIASCKSSQLFSEALAVLQQRLQAAERLPPSTASKKIATMRYNRALCHHYNQNFDSAIADYNSVLAMTDNSHTLEVDTLLGRAASLVAKGQLNDALRDCDDAVERDPDSWLAKHNR